MRKWQTEAINLFHSSNKKSFLVDATPGSGKTHVACRIAADLIERGQIQRVIVVTPSRALKDQWKDAAHEHGLEIENRWRPEKSALFPPDMHGLAITYQQCKEASLVLRRITSEAKTLVIPDEIHHCRTDKAFGTGLLMAFDHGETRFVPLTGTAFRSDSREIPFVRYDDNGTSQADFTYSYGQALRDGVCRSVFFPRMGGTGEWSWNGDIKQASFDDDVNKEEQNRRLGSIVMPAGKWLPDVLREANHELDSMRLEDRNAGGIVFAFRQSDAKKIGRMLRDSVVVVSEDKDSQQTIKDFRHSKTRWIVSVGMVSEGVDIHRLRVAVYATLFTTEMYFRQCVGRIVRRRPGEDDPTSHFYIPDDARLRRLAQDIKEQRVYVLEDDQLDPRESRETGNEIESRFIPIGSSNAEQIGMIHDGEVYDAEEIRFAEMMRETTFPGIPKEHLATIFRAAKNFRTRERLETEAPRADRKQALRQSIKSLVTTIHVRTNLEYNEIHRRVNAEAGIRSMQKPDVTESDLSRVFEAAKKWAVGLSRV